MAQRWLQIVKKEHEAPDLWKLATSGRQLLVGEDTRFAPNNLPLTEAEQRFLAERVEAIGRYLTEQADLSEDERREVNEKLDYLVESAKRTGRLDWKNIFVRTIALALQAGLEAIPGKRFPEFATQQITHFYPAVVKRLPGP